MRSEDVVATYFISTATWLRQAAALDSLPLPVLRLQRRRVRLRVRNERIALLPEGCSLHAIVYAVPSRLRKLFSDSLVRRAHDWAEGGRQIGESGGLVVYFEPPDRLSVDPTLPGWV